MSTPDELEREFDMMMAKAGASVPPELRHGVMASYVEMQAMAEKVHGPRTAAAEPSNTFSLKTFVRGA